ncbi:MAG TPA: nuclear transport factor 2 family protein [Candidatus Eisenbacteria bacterium]
MTDQLQLLIDRANIVDTINRLFVSTDRRDWPAVLGCLAERVQVDMSSVGAGPAREMSGEELAGMWEAGLAPITAVHHQAGNHLVEVRGTTARAYCYAIATHWRAVASGNNMRTFTGSYDIALTCEEMVWRISSFAFHLKYMEGNAQLETEPPA